MPLPTWTRHPSADRDSGSDSSPGAGPSRAKSDFAGGLSAPGHKAPGDCGGGLCRIRRSGLPSGVLERHNRRDVLRWRVLYRRHSNGYPAAGLGTEGRARHGPQDCRRLRLHGWFAHREFAGKFCIYPRTLFSPAAGVIGRSHPRGLLQPGPRNR